MAEEKYVPRLKTKYNNEVKQQLQDKFQYESSASRTSTACRSWRRSS